MKESQFDMIKKLELPFEDFTILKQYCDKLKIDFLSTPDGEQSLNCLVDLNVSKIKIGSTEVTNYPFLKKIAQSKKKVILSTGMSNIIWEKYLIIVREVHYGFISDRRMRIYWFSYGGQAAFGRTYSKGNR